MLEVMVIEAMASFTWYILRLAYPKREHISPIRTHCPIGYVSIDLEMNRLDPQYNEYLDVQKLYSQKIYRFHCLLSARTAGYR